MIQREAVVTRKEIEARLAKVGDYVKMDYLQACLKKSLDFDTKKFVLVTLAQIYESRRMYLEAARLVRTSAEINTTYESKMNDFMRSMSLYLKGGNFEEAEISFAKALACAEGMQKERLKAQRKQAYLEQAKEYVSKDKRKHAMEAYERYLNFAELAPGERKEAQQTLLSLYEQLGKIAEYGSLKRMMENPAAAQQSHTRQRMHTLAEPLPPRCMSSVSSEQEFFRELNIDGLE